jgi:hypothetical protein
MNKVSQVKFCCQGFRANFENAGARGYGLIIGKDSLNNLRVHLQHRVVDKGLESSIQCEGRDIPVSLVAEVGIKFCPWCGCDVREYYQTENQTIDNSSFFIPDI